MQQFAGKFKRFDAVNNKSSFMNKRLKLALLVPNYRWNEVDKRALWHIIPYSLCLLAEMVSDICDVTIIDAYTADMTPQVFKETLKTLQPDVVGITVSMDQFSATGHLAAKLIKWIDPNITTILGGVYATVNPELAVEDEYVDYVVIGEGEYVIRDLIHYLIGKGSLPNKGVCYKTGDSIVNTQRAELIEDLDALPLPAYHLIDFEAYSNSAPRKSVDSPSLLPYARIMTSRGCPQQCIFCQVETIAGRKFRPRSSENVIKEIAWLKERYNIRSIIFDDDNLFANQKRAKAIFKGMIEQNLSLPWKSIATAVFRLDEELIELMRLSGCQYICIAIESGSERVLKKIIKKPVKYEHAKKMVDVAQKHGIFVSANFIIGFPTETWYEIRQTIKFAEDLKANYVKIFNAIPLRHTRLWDLCVKESAFKKGFDWNKISWNVGQIETDEFTANDLCILRAYEWDRINFSSIEKCEKTAQMMHISVEELQQIRRETLKSSTNTICENYGETY